MLPTIFGEFRAVADPSLAFTKSGKGVASVRLVASKSKQVDKADGSGQEWVDDKVIWLNGTMWNSDNGHEAENLCESIKQGDLVEIRGVLFQREYETKEGEKRTSVEVNLYSIAPSIRWATAKVTKADRKAAPAATEPASDAPADDPWATPPSSDEPPF